MKKAKSFLTFVYTWINRLKKSTTIVFNSAMLTAFQIVGPVGDALPTVKDYLTPDLYKWLFLGVVAVNIILRFKTKEPLANK